MIIDFTKSEQRQIEELESKYERLLADAEDEIARLRPGADAEPDPTGALQAEVRALRAKNGAMPATDPKDPAFIAWSKENDRINKIMDDRYKEWINAGGDDWKAARKKKFDLMSELQDARRQLLRQCELRQFSELQGKPEKIIANAKDQMERLIKDRYEGAKRQQAKGDVFSYYYLRVDGNDLYLDPETLISDSKDLLRLHYDFFKDDKKQTETIKKIVLDTIANSPYADRKGKLFAIVNNTEKQSQKPKPQPPAFVSKFPKQYITQTAKLTRFILNGELKQGKVKYIDIMPKSKKKLYSKIYISLNDPQIKITGKRELTPYDREVHDAIVTLCIDGENEFITPQMIYRAMTGNNAARLSPKQQETISESLSKLMYSRLQINKNLTKEEKETLKSFESFKYEGAIIAAEKLTATTKGEVIEVLHLFRTPVLYTYASQKNQIGRIDIKLLNSPISKNEEAIILQGYLYRRILAMQHNDNLSRTIVYDTIYKQLNIETANNTQSRVKKLRIRKQIKSVLEYWKEQGFIKGFSEATKNTTIVSISVKL